MSSRFATIRLSDFCAVVDLALGTVLAAEPLRRLQGVGLTYIRPAHVWWGAALAILGLLIMLLHRDGSEIGLWLAATWYGFFAGVLVYTAATHNDAGLLGIVLFPAFMGLHMLTALRRVR